MINVNESDALKAKIRAAVLELTNFLESEMLEEKPRERLRKIKDDLSEPLSNKPLDSEAFNN